MNKTAHKLIFKNANRSALFTNKKVSCPFIWKFGLFTDFALCSAFDRIDKLQSEFTLTCFRRSRNYTLLRPKASW